MAGFSEFEEEIEDTTPDDETEVGTTTGLKRFGVLGKKVVRFSIL